MPSEAMAPAALSLVSTTFTDPRERGRPTFDPLVPTKPSRTIRLRNWM